MSSVTTFPRGKPTSAAPVRRTPRVSIRERRRAGTTRPVWVIQFEPGAELFVKPLMGWIGARVPVDDVQLEFASRVEAMAYAARHGWVIELEPRAPDALPRLALREQADATVAAHTAFLPRVPTSAPYQHHQV